MARTKLTAGRIRDFECPADTAQAFLWDTEAPGLAVRATPGSKSRGFIFQGRLNGKALRVTIGDIRTWGIDGARAEARRLQTLIDQGIDPRQEKAERIAATEAKRDEATRADVLFEDAWQAYVKDRGPRWSDRYRQDHLYAIAGKDSPQPLASFVGERLTDLTEKRVHEWLGKEAEKRPTQAACAFRKLRAFAGWCESSEAYARLIDPAVFRQKRIVEAVPRTKAKDDCLQREQLKLWFEHVRRLHSPVQAAYLQALLLTGARREELASLRWEDVDFQWKGMTIKDKVEGERTIGLTPYVAALLRDLKARNETPPPKPRKLRPSSPEPSVEWKPSPWVFYSRTAVSGRIQRPNTAHDQALAAAGLPPLTLHGLRRSFGTLAEWVECPAGISAQIMGHKPSALAEKHYRRRPLDLLRMWHIKIEAWILRQAGVEQPDDAGISELRIVQ